MPIKVLDSDLISRIAAGEVIERPASVVKELVENSLDAGSDQISVEITGGGTTLIRVTDNGIGIPADELEIAFLRHATSKINSFSDLEAIGTLGFRGEALPSIAAVSKFEVVTCAEGETGGSFINLKEGHVTDAGSRGRARGTTMTVRDLLKNVPARLKFLKTTSTENGHIANVVTQYALAYPGIRFTLTVEGRTTVRTPGTGNLIDAVMELYGAETAASMIEIPQDGSAWQNGPTVSGMIGAASVSRSNRNFMSFFVNNRWITSRTLNYAVEEAYHGMMMQGRHPVSIINITIPAGDVDVNIHPTKTEVKFKDDRPVFSAVQRAVRNALLAQSPVPAVEELRQPYHKPSQPVNHRFADTLFSTPPSMGGQPSQPSYLPPAGGIQPTPLSALPVLRLVGQVAGTYIIGEGPDGLYVIDQHAAHERIRFEQIHEQSRARAVEIQGLLEPVTLDIAPGQAAVLQECYTDLAEFGFTIEPFGERTYLVRAVPAMLGEDWRDALTELLDAMAEEKGADWREKTEISIACHNAIRAGQILSEQEMRELLRQLEKTATPNTCPHGRPTIIRLTTAQLEREFRRV